MTLPTTIIAESSIDLSHERIHEGNHFYVRKVITGLNAGVAKNFLIIPPSEAEVSSDTVLIHIIYGVFANPGADIAFFEGSTVSSNGTEITPINNNRASDTTSVTKVFEDPVITSVGTQISEDRAGTPADLGMGGRLNRDEDEIILRPGTNYIFRVTPLADNTDIRITLDWYDNRPSSPIPF
jgi:hypothetical protein